MLFGRWMGDRGGRARCWVGDARGGEDARERDGDARGRMDAWRGRTEGY